MLAQDVGVDVVGVDGAMPAKKVAKAGTIKDGARTDDPLGRQRRGPQSNVSEDVDGIGDHEEDGVAGVLDDVGDDAAADFDVLTNQIKARLGGLLLGTGGDDDDIGISTVGIIANTDVDRWGEKQAMTKIHDLGLDVFGVEVDHDDLASYAADL